MCLFIGKILFYTICDRATNFYFGDVYCKMDTITISLKLAVINVLED